MTERRPGTFYQHGWQSWNVAAWRPADAPLRYPVIESHRLQSTDPAHLDDPFPGGATVGALVRDDGQIELLGALGCDAWVSLKDGALRGEGDGEWFHSVGSETDVFSAYRSEIARTFGYRGGNPGRVWCSWYSFYSTVSEAGLGDVLDSLGDLAFDVVQIDDGWQQANGDWNANNDFPAGMTAAAARIRDTGRRAGLWLAPFIVSPRSRLFERYPDMILRDSDGEPVIAAYNWGPSYTLDVTRDDARDWLAQQMADIVAQGYDYLKLDFLYAAALPGRHAQPSGRETAYRQASRVIREAVGDTTYLLACGAPIIPSIGIYDGLRVGPDVAEHWDNVDRTRHLADRAAPGAADAITTTLGRYWLKGLIDIDPDVTYFRSRYCMLTGQQKQDLADLAHICGFRANSDLPAWLLPEERRRLQDFLTQSPEIAQLDHYRFRIDERIADFSSVVDSRPW